MKSFNVKVNPPRRSRAEIIRKCNVGFVPEYQTSTEGIGQSLRDRKNSIRRFSEGMARILTKKNPE